MLVVLNGYDTDSKNFLSKQITAYLNNFVFEGYNVDFKKQPFEVTNSLGIIVYTPGDEVSHGVQNLDMSAEEGYEFANRLLDWTTKVFPDDNTNTSYNDAFLDLLFDYGIVPERSNVVDPGTPNAGRVYDYNDIITAYKNRLYDKFVITGEFSKAVIDQLKSDLGAENVSVYNFIRNPSATFLTQVPYTVNALDTDKPVRRAIFNSANLKRFNDITTIKFEDILAAGKVVIEGVEIPLPVEYTASKPNLTQWEKDNVLPSNLVSSEQLDQFNSYASNFDFTDLEDGTYNLETIVPAINARYGTNITAEDLNVIPTNLFDALGYTPLTYNQIVNGNI